MRQNPRAFAATAAALAVLGGCATGSSGTPGSGPAGGPGPLLGLRRTPDPLLRLGWTALQLGAAQHGSAGGTGYPGQ